VSKSLTNYLVYKFQNHYHFCDDYFQNGAVTMSVALLLIKAAIILVTHECMHIPFQIPYLHYQKSLTLCWRSVSGGGNINTNHIIYKCSQTSIIGKCHSTAIGLYKMQRPNLLTLCWRSVDALLMLCWCSVDALLTLCWQSVDTVLTVIFWCSDIEIDPIAYQGIQYFDHG